jgi:HAD superfamily hydrolase (TIGR01490 family)
MQLALFDLDNTLIPMDSDHAWGEFMVKIGAVDAASHRAQNDQFYRDYQAGCLDNDAYLNFQLAPLAKYSRSQLAEWHRLYMEENILPNIHPQALALVKKHQEAGDLCVLVTATNEFVTAPIAQVFGIEHLIATQLATVDTKVASAYTGKTTGIPNFREGKVLRTQAWLAERGTTLSSYSASYFYSDSANDIPLLEKVSHPVATNPDAKLKALSQANGWPILELFKTS